MIEVSWTLMMSGVFIGIVAVMWYLAVFMEGALEFLEKPAAERQQAAETDLIVLAEMKARADFEGSCNFDPVDAEKPARMVT